MASKNLKPIAGNNANLMPGQPSIGTQKYRLLKAAFKHALDSFSKQSYLEVIAILESILHDRIGSVLHGMDNTKILTLGDATGQLTKKLIETLQKEINSVKPRYDLSQLTRLRDLVKTGVEKFRNDRNKAIHGMAQLKEDGDESFSTRYNKLRGVCLEGVKVLLEFDELDQKLKLPKKSATFPDALKLSDEVRDALASEDYTSELSSSEELPTPNR